MNWLYKNTLPPIPPTDLCELGISLLDTLSGLPGVLSPHRGKKSPLFFKSALAAPFTGEINTS